MLLTFNPSQDKGKMWQLETQTTFGDLSMLFENRFLYTYSDTLLGMRKISFRRNVFEINC